MSKNKIFLLLSLLFSHKFWMPERSILKLCHVILIERSSYYQPLEQKAQFAINHKIVIKLMNTSTKYESYQPGVLA